LVLSGGSVRLRVKPESKLTADGQPATEMTLKSDADGQATVLDNGRIRFYLIKRGSKLGVRVKDRKSPALSAFHGIDSYPVDLRWRFDARFEAYDPPKMLDVPNILGSVEKQKSPGAVVFRSGERDLRLDAVLEDGSDELFLIFGDPTNGVAT